MITLIVTLFLPELPLSRQSAAEKIHQETSGTGAAARRVDDGRARW